ncbi:hypothetical protein BDV93DRAFT_515411 [Ceratobasidium sp. AG-I]|nr:hypothetical protein BDV93DRAFT_515411 [Ceratobasidium sp. AG-I]
MSLGQTLLRHFAPPLQLHVAPPLLFQVMLAPEPTRQPTHRHFPRMHQPTILAPRHLPLEDLVNSPIHSSPNPFVDNSRHAHAQQVSDTYDRDPFSGNRQLFIPASPHPFLHDNFSHEQQLPSIPSTPNIALRTLASTVTPSPTTSAHDIGATPLGDDLFALDLNNDPKLSTYGNGDGDLLPPRHIATRTLPEDLKSLDRKERKQVRNRIRAKASDYAETENKILQAATARLIALSTCQDPLPTTERENALCEECWAWGARSLHKRITHDKDLLYLLKRNLVNHRTGCSNAAGDVVASHYHFRIDTSNSSNTDSPVESFNSDLAIELLDDDSFVFGDYKTREDPYQNELISFLFLKLWFQDSRSAGVQHPDIFLPVKITTLAYITTLLEKSIKEWKPGARKAILFSGDSHRSRVDYFEGQIKKFCNHPLIKREHIFEDYPSELECSARKKIKQLSTVKLEDATHSEDESSGGGLKDADIERMLKKRMQAKVKTTSVETGSPAGNIIELPPSANNEVDIGGAGEVGEMRRVPLRRVEVVALGLDLGFAASYEARDNWDPHLVEMNMTQYSVPTLYPKDSISQQIPSNSDNLALLSSGYLEQLHNPFMS